MKCLVLQSQLNLGERAHTEMQYLLDNVILKVIYKRHGMALSYLSDRK